MRISAFAVLIFFATSGSLSAQIQNGGFEANPSNPSGWESSGNVQILQTFSTAPYYPDQIYQLVSIDPCEGQNFVMLYTGGGSEATNHGEISQVVTVAEGETISGVYFFCTCDWLGWNDFGSIKLIPDRASGLNEILLAKKTVEDVGDHGSMAGWARFSHTFTALESGTYTLTIRVEDAVDLVFASFMAADDINIVPAPPMGCQYTLTGDINDDCKVDFFDLALLAGQWLNICDDSTWCNNCDIDRNPIVEIGYTVNFSDFALGVANWIIDCNTLPVNAACVPK